MKQIKYSFNGGLPLSQNVLDYMQTGIKDALAALGGLGYNGDPVIISGCNNAGAGVYNPGWIFNGTEIVYFVGGDSVALGTTMIKLIEHTSTVVFENGATQGIYSEKKYEFDNTGTIDITDLLLFHLALGDKNQGIIPDGVAIMSTVGGTGTLAGQLQFKKHIYARTMQISGATAITAPSAIASPPVYQNVGNLSAAFRPATEVHFKANVEGYILETGGTLRFNDINGRITITGDVAFQFIKPDAGVSSYTIKVNTIVPLT
jgi:hypothetical protein